MKDFIRYQHIERFGTPDVEGIDVGECYVFPKIDGTNSSVWLKDGKIAAGSRNRELTLDNDNAGFLAWAVTQDNLYRYLEQNPTHRLFGEWLVPHTLRTYREDAWRKFYVFDVMVNGVYMHYDHYQNELYKYGIDYIVPLARIVNPSKEQLLQFLDKNDFLIETGKGSGEGIVIKNYDYLNPYGRQIWAKIVASEFKDKHRRDSVITVKGKKTVEMEIVDLYVTVALCEKVKAKIENEHGFSSKDIPRLLNTVYHDLVVEESWNFVKKFKNPIIDYKELQKWCFRKVKENLPELF